jgi:hypothetical protein
MCFAGQDSFGLAAWQLLILSVATITATVNAVNMSFPLFQFQHELRTAYYFDEHIASLKMNLSDYINDWEITAVSTEPKNPLWKPSRAHGWLADYWAGSSILWRPQPSGMGNHKKADCTYTISGPSMSWHESGSQDAAQLAFYSFNFEVSQTSCVSAEGSKIFGGSTFDVLAYSAHALGSCIVQDYFNNSYAITCRFPTSATTIKLQPRQCMRFTVLLEYEHFDAYNEMLRVSNWDYPSARLPLVDDVEYCGDLPASQRDQGDQQQPRKDAWVVDAVYSVTVADPYQQYSVLTASEYAVSDTNASSAANVSNISIFSGLWVAKAIKVSDGVPTRGRVDGSSSKSQRHELLCANLTLAEWLLRRYPLADSVPVAVPWKRNDALKNVDDYERCLWMAHDYKVETNRTISFDELRISQSSIMPTVATDNIKAGLSSRYFFQPLKQVWNKDRRQLALLLPTFTQQSLSSLLARDDRHYIFIGASHMRYMYAAFVESILGRDAIAAMSHKESYFQAAGGRFIFQDSSYAGWQVNYLLDVCRAVVPEGARNTIILTTGAWDLFTGSIRRLLRSTKSAQQLLQTIADILSSRLPCANIDRIVWVTSMPYPVCYNLECDKERSYRTNSAIGAAVEFYMSTLLKLPIDPSKKLSVVDAFSITQPRIGLNYDHESICTCHFECLVTGSSRQRSELL